MEDDGSLFNVIVHEMAHVIGIGTLWKEHQLVKGSGTNNPLFIGEYARIEYGQLTGSPTPLDVPIANTGGAGTREAHWREDVFQFELMTGFLNAGINPLSKLTIASLRDIGYEVNYNAADPYQIPSNLQKESFALLTHGFCNINIPEYTVLPDHN